MVNKIDVTRPSDLDPARKAMLDNILKEDNVKLLELSCVSEEGVMDVRNTACDALLAHRVESKEKTRRVENVANRVRVAVPVARDGVKREAFIPAAVAARKKYDKTDPERRRLERDIEEENGGAGVFSVDIKSEWQCVLRVKEGMSLTAHAMDPCIVHRELSSGERRLEVRCHARDSGRQERCGLYRPGHCRSPRGARSRRGAIGSCRILRFRIGRRFGRGRDPNDCRGDSGQEGQHAYAESAASAPAEPPGDSSQRSTSHFERNDEQAQGGWLRRIRFGRTCQVARQSSWVGGQEAIGWRHGRRCRRGRRGRMGVGQWRREYGRRGWNGICSQEAEDERGRGQEQQARTEDGQADRWSRFSRGE